MGGEVSNVSVLVPIDVDLDGCREVQDACEDGREDKANWLGFLRRLKARG